MLFHTTDFLVFFLVFLPFFALAKQRPAAVPYVIFAFSQVFYGWWDWRFLILLWITIGVDYAIGIRLGATEEPWKRKALLVLALTTSLSILGFFKYWNFFVDTAHAFRLPGAESARIADLVLPVGISFYTFQSMAYIVDVYRGVHQPVRSLVAYAAFVCYFPQLVAGPIERVGRLLPQLIQPVPATPDRIASGVALFSYGFFLKALGDVLGTFHNPVFADLENASPPSVVAAIFTFGLQIYFDFAGYTEMARGVSRMLGIELMRNFRAPYLSLSFREFWTRWHVSLSQWLRDYVYISLGGNRVRVRIRFRNLMLTMLLGGLWHGASWNFVIWGGLHGLYLVANTALDLWGFGRGGGAVSRLIRAAVAWVVTFVGVTYAWLYFRITTFEEALVANRKIYEWLVSGDLWAWSVPSGLALLVGVVFLVDLVRRDATDVFPVVVTGRRRALGLGAASAGFVATGLVLLIGMPSHQFIYFQF
jgi:alginate O-acetyltransferase complex protein AlgI